MPIAPEDRLRVGAVGNSNRWRFHTLAATALFKQARATRDITLGAGPMACHHSALRRYLSLDYNVVAECLPPGKGE